MLMTSPDNINAGKPWTKQEDELLTQLYNIDKLDVIQIAKIHGRAPGGIISRCVKNQLIGDKKAVRGYEDYLKLEQSNSTEKPVKQPKPVKPVKLPKITNYSNPLDSTESDNKDEIITIDNIEYILSNGKVYEVKKIKGQIYGQYDEKTSTVKALKSHVRKIINYLTTRGEITVPILWAGSDLSTVKQYFPNLIFQDIYELTDDSPGDFAICICSNHISQIETSESTQIDTINGEIEFISSLVGPNADLLVFENKDFHEDLVPICIQNNFKIIDTEPAISSKSNYIFAIKKPQIEKQGIMVLDTETTGFPTGRDPKDWEKFNSARLIELGYIVYDATGKKIKEYDSLVKPDNWTITNSFVHGITQADAIANGKPITNVLAELSADLNQVSAFVCHNINFDMDIILAEAHRGKNTTLVNQIDSKRKICTMELGKKFIKTTKRPKLVELYQYLFKKEFKQEHRALSDCIACADCFYSITC